MPVVAVNQYGTLPNGRSLFGRSRMVDAKGLIVAGMSDKEGYFVGEIDKEYTQKCRKKIQRWKIDVWIYIKHGITNKK